jgi:DNA ligase (NAD+)
MPRTCPVCGAGVVRAQTDTPGKLEAATRCINADCPAQVKEHIKHFAAKGAFDIDGMGDKLIDQLVDKGLVTSCADIFTLKREDLEKLERMGPKSAANLVQAIAGSKIISLGRFLYALGIRHVGENVAGILASRFGTLARLLEIASQPPAQAREAIQSLSGIGEVIAESVAGFFSREENRTTLQRILASGVEVAAEVAAGGGPLAGKVFVLTGTLEGMTRAEAQRLIEKAGGKVTGTVTGNTSYLVAGGSPGSKLAQAQALGTAIIDEATLKTLL